MKTKTWLLIIGAILVVCGIAAAILFAPNHSAAAEILLDGTVVKTVDLRVEQTFSVESEWGSNTVVVENGTVRVSEASCPDHVCIERGACSGGAPIVCLPNRLVIRFTNATLDAAVG